MLSHKNASAQAVALGGGGQSPVLQPGFDMAFSPVVGQLINAPAMVAGANRQDGEIPIHWLQRSSSGCLSGLGNEIHQVQALEASPPSQLTSLPATTELLRADPGMASAQAHCDQELADEVRRRPLRSRAGSGGPARQQGGGRRRRRKERQQPSPHSRGNKIYSLSVCLTQVRVL